MRSPARINPVSVQQAASHFDVDPATIRRWVSHGCPVVHRGRRGPGNGSSFDLHAVTKWRAAKTGHSGLSVDEVVQKIAEALLTAIDDDLAHVRAGVTREAASAMTLVIWERTCAKFGRRFKFDEQPDPIRALARIL